MDIQAIASGSQPGQRVADTGTFSASAPAVAQSASPVQTVNAVAQSAQVPDIGQTKDAVKKLNDAMRALSQNLEFTVDTDIHRTIVKVVDTQTQQVIRQMPTPEAVEIAKALDRLQGLLIKQQA